MYAHAEKATNQPTNQDNSNNVTRENHRENLEERQTYVASEQTQSLTHSLTYSLTRVTHGRYTQGEIERKPLIFHTFEADNVPNLRECASLCEPPPRALDAPCASFEEALFRTHNKTPHAPISLNGHHRPSYASVMLPCREHSPTRLDARRTKRLEVVERLFVVLTEFWKVVPFTFHLAPHVELLLRIHLENFALGSDTTPLCVVYGPYSRTSKPNDGACTV